MLTPRNKLFLFAVIFSFVFNGLSAQEDVEKRKKVLDTLTYQTQSGLPIAASKIYFSDSKFTISGFGESNYIHYEGSKNRESNDLELYYTNLQRFVVYGAYKPVNWLVLYGEFFLEYLNDGNREGHFEYLPELFADFLISDKFNVRVGSHQPNLGFINNNDEPIMFYSVNRPEVERLIIPSQWIDLGVMTYGNFTPDFKWVLSVYQGLDASNLNGSTWIRRGRDETLRFNFDSYVLNSRLLYTGVKNTELSLSGVWSQIGKNEKETGEMNRQSGSEMYLLSSYIRHEHKNWNFMVLGTYGKMANTDRLYELTVDEENGPQVLGEQVYGFYIETSCDILPYFRGSEVNRPTQNKNFLFN